MFVHVNGVKLFFDVDGEVLTPDGAVMRQKPTVVLVHGGPGADHSVSKPYFGQITDIAQVVYYDHRGNGRSEDGKRQDWTLTQWADDLKGLCDALGIEKPIVIGTSFGGFVALSYATRFPDHAGGLALISTAAKVEFSAIFDAFERLGGERVKHIAQSYWTHPTDEGRDLYRTHCVPFYSDHEKPAEWPSRVLWRNETALWFNGPNNEHGRFDFREDLKNIRCPVLVMVGEDDPITPPEFSDAIVENLTAETVTYAKFENCGHGVVGDKPTDALRLLRALVAGIADGLTGG